jgi:DNA-binding beta-propeller fold protein YncE
MQRYIHYYLLFIFALLAAPLFAHAALVGPVVVAFDPQGNLFVADQANGNVVEIATSTDVIIKTYTGSG